MNGANGYKCRLKSVTMQSDAHSLLCGRCGPPPHEPFESVLCFRVAVLTIEYRGPPHPNPLPEERVPDGGLLFLSMVQGRDARACVGTSHPGPGWGEGRFNCIVTDKCRALRFAKDLAQFADIYTRRIGLTCGSACGFLSTYQDEQRRFSGWEPGVRRCILLRVTQF